LLAKLFCSDARHWFAIGNSLNFSDPPLAPHLYHVVELDYFHT
jgi:hypothetical protein